MYNLVHPVYIYMFASQWGKEVSMMEKFVKYDISSEVNFDFI